MPGVVAARALSVEVVAKRETARVGPEDLLAAFDSGGLTVTRRSTAAGAKKGGVQRRAGAAGRNGRTDLTPSEAREGPSRSGLVLSVCSALVVAAERGRRRRAGGRSSRALDED